MTEEVTMKKLDIKEIKKGDLMAFVYYAKVENVSSNGLHISAINLDTETKETFQVTGEELISKSRSADWYDEEIKESKTALAERLTHSGGKPFTVCFDKQDGEERILKGRLVKPEPLLGRSMVEDLEVDLPKHRVRQVDHRTLHWMIVDGVKYTVK